MARQDGHRRDLPTPPVVWSAPALDDLGFRLRYGLEVGQEGCFMTTQLQRREVDFRTETFEERRYRQVERCTTFIPGEHLRDARDINLPVCSLASGQDDNRGGMD